MLLHLLLALCVPLWSYGEGTSQQLPSCQEVIGTNDSFSAQCILMTGRSREKQPPGLDEEPADKQPKVALVQEDPAFPQAAEDPGFRDLHFNVRMDQWFDAEAAKLRIFLLCMDATPSQR